MATVLMLVLLRLSIGWHFFQEGAEKHRGAGSFSSQGFLLQAKGPLAGMFHGMVPDQGHAWRRWLAQPREHLPETEPETDTFTEDVIPTGVPYWAWADQIKQDWRTTLQQMIQRCGLDEEQKGEAAKIYDRRTDQLRTYLAEQHDDIISYQHEIHRLQQLESDATAGEAPFQDQRIALKRNEVLSMPGQWVQEVETMRQGLEVDLWGLLTKDQEEAGEQVLAPRSLKTIDQVVTYWTLGVGVCLLAGLFTRTASLAGALFLLSVIATQPPGTEGAQEMYKEFIEMIALLTLATTAVGRWGGLDFFIHALWQACCGTKGCCGTKEKTP